MDLLEKNKATFLHKSTLIYGGSNCGKTSIIKDILYHIKDEISAAVVICPTELNHGTYTEGEIPIIPKQFLHTEYNDSLMNDIFKFQDERIRNYKKINCLPSIESIYNTYPSQSINTTVDRLKQLLKDDLNALSELGAGEQYSARTIIKEKFNQSKLILYKNHISANRKLFLDRNKSEESIYIINNINFNPNMVLVMDDVSPIMEKTKNNKMMIKIATEGRHYKITFILAIHASRVVPPLLRTNAHNFVFADKKTAGSYMEGNKTQYSLADRRDFSEKIQNITMNSEIHLPIPMRNRKVFFTTEEQKYYIYKADLHEPFSVVPKNIIEFAKSIKRE